MSRFEGKYELTPLMSHEDLPKPNEFGIGTMYLVGKRGYEREVWFLCPCDCGHIRAISIVSSGWRLTRNQDGTFSISPSISDIGGCRSHFYIENSRVRWC